MNSAELTIIISSCDNFSDCWEPFAHGLTKYWKDCPFQTVLITNHKIFNHPIIKTCNVGEDKGWAKNLIKAVQAANTEYVLYIQEDNWIKKPVDTAVILEYVDLLRSNLADYVRLYPCPEPKIACPFNKKLGLLSNSDEYRASLQAAIWRTSTLLALVNPEDTPWQFELAGTERSRKYGERFLSVKRFHGPAGTYHSGLDYVCTAINKGRWSKAARNYASTEGLTIDFSHRPHETAWHDFLRDSEMGRFCVRVIAKLTNFKFAKRKL